MIFTELRFIVLFVAAWVCFASAPKSWRSMILAVWGVVFYGLYANLFLVVVLALALIVFLSKRSGVAVVAGTIVVGLLIYFKARATSNDVVFQSLGTGGIVVPLGLSYLSFELLHVLIERRRGKLAQLRLSDLLAYVFFVPARIAGPIKRYSDFTAAVRDAVISWERLYSGLIRVLIGLAKKLLVADVLRLTVVLEVNVIASTFQAWKVLLAFAFQIYFDFSAYTDVAIGCAWMLGIALPENFRRPYLAVNIRDFWDRWHITLSHWVRDYVFVQVGRGLFQTRLRRLPVAIGVLSYLVTFLIVGAWHGLAITFCVWGLYHGALLAAYHVIRAKMPPAIAVHPLYHSRFADALGVATTFVCVSVGWVPFMTDWENGLSMLRWMFGGGA